MSSEGFQDSGFSYGVQFENYLDVENLWHQLFDQTNNIYFTDVRLIFYDTSKLKSDVINQSK